MRTAALDGRAVEPDDLRAAVRAQNGAGLDRLARRVEPGVGWNDLVLPPTTHRRLRELALRARHRERVLGQWGMRPGGGRGRGVVALFAGESGTGKTMSAEVVAADLGMDLYVVDLSTVVDKYIGETEKNLERIFTGASAVNAVLLFDEADAIFGKRSEVKDAHDRHANIESAYLLQRMESFDGIAVLTTNLRANLDEAFTRRLDVVADFPVPNAEQRLALWDRCLGTRLPRDDNLRRGAWSPRLLRRPLRAGRRFDPGLRGHRGLPRRRVRRAAHHGAGGHRGRAGVPQARTAGPGERVRAVPGAGRGGLRGA